MNKSVLFYMWQQASHWSTVLAFPILFLMIVNLQCQVSALEESRADVKSRIFCVSATGKVSECDFDMQEGDEKELQAYVSNAAEEIMLALYANKANPASVKSEASSVRPYFRSGSKGIKVLRSELRDAIERASEGGTQLTLQSKGSHVQYVKKYKSWAVRSKGVMTFNTEGEENKSFYVSVDIAFVEPTPKELKQDPERIMIISKMKSKLTRSGG